MGHWNSDNNDVRDIPSLVSYSIGNQRIFPDIEFTCLFPFCIPKPFLLLPRKEMMKYCKYIKVQLPIFLVQRISLIGWCSFLWFIGYQRWLKNKRKHLCEGKCVAFSILSLVCFFRKKGNHRRSNQSFVDGGGGTAAAWQWRPAVAAAHS